MPRYTITATYAAIIRHGRVKVKRGWADGDTEEEAKAAWLAVVEPEWRNPSRIEAFNPKPIPQR